jgi:hypothetical protein
MELSITHGHAHALPSGALRCGPSAAAVKTGTPWRAAVVMACVTANKWFVPARLQDGRTDRQPIRCDDCGRHRLMAIHPSSLPRNPKIALTFLLPTFPPHFMALDAFFKVRQWACNPPRWSAVQTRRLVSKFHGGTQTQRDVCLHFNTSCSDL